MGPSLCFNLVPLCWTLPPSSSSLKCHCTWYASNPLCDLISQFLWLPSGPLIDLCAPINIFRTQEYGWLPIAPDMLLICWQFYKTLWRSMATEIYSFTFPYRNLSWLEIPSDHQASCSKWYSFSQPNVAITSNGGPLQSSLNMFDWV